MKRLLALSLAWGLLLLSTIAQAQESFRIRRQFGDDTVDGYVPRSVMSSRIRQRTAEEPSSGETSLGRQLFEAFAASPAPYSEEVRGEISHANPVPPVVTRLLSPKDMAQIARRDVVIVIDKSGSMSEKDCPGDNRAVARWLPLFLGQGSSTINGTGMVSRWEWCRRQAMDLARQTSRAIPGGFTIVLFDGRDVTYNNVTANAIPAIFNENRPNGGTNTVGALKRQIEAYFRRKNSEGAKPLLIAVITDGAPDSPHRLKELIAETTQKMQSPDEIVIAFLQIGNDPKGYELLSELDDNLRKEHAAHDIVQTQPFQDVMRAGLAQSLVQAIQPNRKRYVLR